VVTVIVELPVPDGDLVAARLAAAIAEAGELSYELADGVVVSVPVGDITVEQ
jgi:hypothetical protein